LWETIPFFKYIIFPTRWLHITAFAAAFLSAPVFVPVFVDNRINRKCIYLPAILLLACIALDLSFITQALCFNKKELSPAIAVNWVMEHLPNGVRTDKIDKKDDNGNEAGYTIQDGGSARVVSWKSEERVVEVKAKKPVVVRFRTFNFPGWSAYLDGARAEISTETDTRAIMVNVPPGNHRLELLFKDTPIRRYGKLISLVSFIMFSTYLVTAQVLKLKE